MSNDSSITTSNCQLSTIDNPFNPFEQFDDWFMFDIEKGYYSCSKQARLANITDDMTEQEENEEIERAIDEFIKHDFTGLYMKVKRNTEIPVNE